MRGCGRVAVPSVLTAVLLVVGWITAPAASARILAVFPHVGKSHYYMFKPLVYHLATIGHQVTVVTHFPDDAPPPNISFVDLRVPGDQVIFNSVEMQRLDDMPSTSEMRAAACIPLLYGMGVDVCRKGLAHPNLQELVKKKKDLQFDLAIVEFFNTDCFASLAHVFQVPLIGIFSSVMMPWHNERFGNPDHPGYIPNHFLQYPSRMNLLQRTANTITTLANKLAYSWWFDSTADNLVHEFIGKDIPSVRDIVNNASLFLVNTHFTLFQPRPLVPAIIEIGGFHVTPANPANNSIAPDVIEFMDKSPDRIIFFSMGSSLKGSSMPSSKVRMFQNVFARLPVRVLWKWEDDTMPGKPDNVMIKKWFPQNDILGSGRVSVFITHSGLMGTEEAVYHGVPMLMMPVLGDQPVNAASCEEKGLGIILDYYSFSETSLQHSLEQLLFNKRYKEKASEVARMFMDRPASVLDTAVYWIEYVIRYRGAPHLRSAATQLTWYQYYLLDVILLLSVAIYIPCKALATILRLCCTKKSNHSNVTTKNKIKKH